MLPRGGHRERRGISAREKRGKKPMRLRIYNTEKRKKEDFAPLSPPHVKMYCCGPTVYDLLHIGNFRGAVFFNFLRGWLEFLGYKVEYFYNFTDIDDKILSRAKKEGRSPRQIAEKYIKEFQKDCQALKLRPHTGNPKATEAMPEIIRMIQKLTEAGAAYEADGDVFYSVRSFKGYGRLSGRGLNELLSGARIEPNDKKKDPLDFSLWKKHTPEEPGKKKPWEAFWDSPWGPGRPGWHIECSAMIHKFLGEEIDIHGGGSDLIFPHHENEIAQSEACSGKKFVRCWLHNNMIVFEGGKMSKSLGNLITMREFLKDFPAEAFKCLVLSSHYRSPLQFSKKTVHQALSSLAGIYSGLAKARGILSESQGEESPCPDFQKTLNGAEREIALAFNDDFATPKAFASLFSVMNHFKSLEAAAAGRPPQKTERGKSAWRAARLLRLFEKYGRILSLFQEPAGRFLQKLDDQLLRQKGLTRRQISGLVKKRSDARAKKDFKAADKIREELEALGIELRDTKKGTEWETKKALEAAALDEAGGGH